MRKNWLGAGIGVALAVLAAAPVLADTAAALAGRTLTAKGAKIVLGADGVMSGSVGKNALQGTWEVSGGKFCRTITAPARLAGTACQKVDLQGDSLTVTREDGSVLVYKVE